MNQEELNSIKIYTIQDIEKAPFEASANYLTDNLIEAKLARLEDRLPTDVISELEQNLKKVKVTERQCDEVIERVIQAYEAMIAGDDFEKIHQRLNELDNYVTYFQQYLENDFQKTAQNKNMDRTINVIGKRAESDIISISILLKWVEFMLGKTGEEHIEEVIRLYTDLGWIDEALGNKMLLLSRGLAVPKSEVSKNSKLTARDHIQSLIFIERLKAIELVELDLLQSGNNERCEADQKQSL